MRKHEKRLANYKKKLAATDVLERYGLYDDDQEIFNLLSKQDALTIPETACLIYPALPDNYGFIRGEEEGKEGGRMSYLTRLIEDGIAATKIKHIKSGGEKRPIPFSAINWAKRNDLIPSDLFKYVEKKIKEKRSRPGRDIESLENDKDFLGAGLALLADKFKIDGKTITATKIRQLIEGDDNYPAFWPNDGSPPKAVQGIERLIGPYQTLLRNFRIK